MGASGDNGPAVKEYPYDDGITVPIGLLEDAIYQYDRLVDARNLLEQANAVEKLSNLMSDLRSWHPGFDIDTGTMPWERDDEEY